MKKTITIKDDELHRKLFNLMREVRFASSRYDESCEDSDLEEMNEKQLEIIGMFDFLLKEKENPCDIIQQLRDLVNRSGFVIPTSLILKVIEENEDLKTHSATSDFCSAEWKNDFNKAKLAIQKIDDATTSDDNPMEKVLVIKNIIEDYNQKNK